MEYIPTRWSLYPTDGYEHFVYEVPSWSRVVILIDAIIFLPLFLIVYYALAEVYLTLAIIEDQKLPAKDLAVKSPKSASDSITSDGITSSLRGIYHLLKATGGFRAQFRGLSVIILTRIPFILINHVRDDTFSYFVKPIAAAGLVQLSAAWVHIVISQPSRPNFLSRLPPFKRTFLATWHVVLLHLAATEVAQWLPAMTAFQLGIDWPDYTPFGPDNTYSFAIDMALGDSIFFLKCAVVILVSAVGSVLVVLPTKVMLFRIQASLLPLEDETIVPFDRTYQSKVMPITLGDQGYATIRDVWSTFTLTRWRCMAILAVKISAAALALLSLFGAVLFLEWSILASSYIELNGDSL
ncbi:hypothetical protein ACHAQJ_003500 [Trichoderma viride]